MKRNIRSLLSELVQRDFPDLCSYELFLKTTASPDCVAGVLVQNRRITIEINRTDIKKMSVNACTGVLVHELCHVERDLKKSLLRRFAEAALGLVLPSVVERNDERATDELVIAKGYGRQLLAYQIFHDNRYEDYTKQDGLTRREIRARLREREKAAAKLQP